MAQLLRPITIGPGTPEADIFLNLGCSSLREAGAEARGGEGSVSD